METSHIRSTIRIVPNSTRLVAMLPTVSAAAPLRPYRVKAESGFESNPLFFEEEQGYLQAGCPFTCGGSCGFTDNC